MITRHACESRRAGQTPGKPFKNEVGWEPNMRWYQRLFRRARTERQLDAELRFHVERQVADYIAAGLTPEEARRRARLEFGGLDQVKEECRDIGAARFVEALIQDVRYGLRQLRRSRGFTIVAVLTLALGIGATTAIFSVVYAVLIEPLPYSHPGRIVALSTSWRKEGREVPRLSGADLIDVESENRVFDAIGTYIGGKVGIQVANHGEFEHVYFVNPDFFRVFSVAPAYGRLLRPGETGAAALISLGLASGLFGGGPAALGHSISVENQAYQIVGILPAGFDFPSGADVWLAAPAQLWNVRRNAYNYSVAARLKGGIGIKQARSQLGAIATRLSAAFPEYNAGKTFRVISLRDELAGRSRNTLLLLMFAVLLLLLIACLNLGSLLLARGAVRARDIALRIALGASRWRIVRQLMMEYSVLAMLGGALGVFFAYWVMKALLYFAPGNLPRLQGVQLDAPALVFTGALSILAALISGLAPARLISRVGLNESMKAFGSQKGNPVKVARLRSVLATGALSLSLLLAATAVLMFRSFDALSAVDLGFHPGGRLVMYVHVPARSSSEVLHVADSFGELVRKLNAIPGVLSASAAMGVPMGRFGSNGSYFIEGKPIKNPPNARVALASPGYFTTMGIPLLRGRAFAYSDRNDTAPVAIVNRALVQYSFGHGDPINKLIRCSFDDQKEWITIIGVVDNTRDISRSSNPGPEIYLPLAQHPYFANEFQVVLRAHLPPDSLASAARKRVQAMYPTAAIDFTTLSEMVATSVAMPRYRLFLTGAFAGLAIVLAIIGLYGVISYLTAQRTAEIGVRLALGAQRGDVVRLVLGQGLRLTLTGVVAGTAGALALARFFSSLLYGVKPTDPVTLIAVSLILTAVALLACYVPSRRAANVDPMVALRHE
jgi:putative ABC transport system permease protein